VLIPGEIYTAVRSLLFGNATPVGVRNKITGTPLVFYALGEKWPADNASAASGVGGGDAPFQMVVLKTLVARLN